MHYLELISTTKEQQKSSYINVNGLEHGPSIHMLKGVKTVHDPIIATHKSKSLRAQQSLPRRDSFGKGKKRHRFAYTRSIMKENVCRKCATVKSVYFLLQQRPLSVNELA